MCGHILYKQDKPAVQLHPLTHTPQGFYLGFFLFISAAQMFINHRIVEILSINKRAIQCAHGNKSFSIHLYTMFPLHSNHTVYTARHE